MSSPEQQPALFDDATGSPAHAHRLSHAEHTHQRYACGHEHGTHNSKLVTARLIGNTAFVNFLSAVVSIPAGASKTVATTIEGMHNLGDSISYAVKWLVSKSEQTDTPARPSMPERLRQRAARHLSLIKRLGYAAISVPAGLGALKSGIDLSPLSDMAQDSSLPSALKEVLEPHKQMNVAAIAASGLSLAWNGGVYATIRRRRQHLPNYTLNANEIHFKEHLRYDTAGAAAAFAGALLQGGAWQVQSVIAAMLGLYGAWHFRPTKKALEHGHGPNRLTALTQKVFARAVTHSTPLAEKARTWREELGAPEARQQRLRKLALGGLAVASVVIGMATWRASQGMVNPDVIAENTGGLAGATPRPEIIPDIPIPEVDPPSPPAPETVSYSLEAKTITPYEGWNQTLSELDVASDNHSELLRCTGDNLSHMKLADGSPVAYWQDLDIPSGGEWRMYMSPDGAMPEAVLNYLLSEAALLAAR